MGLSDSGSIVVSGVQQRVSVAYRNSDYVADRVFPRFNGLSRKTKITKYYKGPWFKNAAGVRAAGTGARKVNYNVTSQELQPTNYALASKIPDEERQNARAPGSLVTDPTSDTVELISEGMFIKREMEVAAVVKSALWSGQAAGGVDAEGNWGNTTAANDTFLADMKTGQDAFHAAGAPMPNKLLLDHYAWQKLRRAPALLGALYPTGFSKNTTKIGLDDLAMLAEVKEVIVARSIYDNSESIQARTDANFTAVDIWAPLSQNDGGLGFLFYSPDKPKLKKPSAGYQYGVNQINGSFTMMTKWREQEIHSDWYDINQEYDISAVSLDCGYLWYDTAKS
jgi:hypothetical protein